MHNALQMRKHRHPSLTLHQTHKPFATARHNHINRIHHRQHFAHGRPIPCRHQLNGSLRQTGSNHPLDQRLVDSRRGMKPFGSAAQDDRVARLETESTSIRSHIGTTFIDYTYDPQRRAHTLNIQPIGALPLFEHLPNRIFLLRHCPQPVDHGANAVFI